MTSTLTVRHLDLLQPYDTIWQEMRAFTDKRTSDTNDELWLLEHFPVFTQGQNGKPEHILYAGDIPIVQTDRGGQVTYHGPGQLMIYTLIDLKRKQLTVRDFVSILEQTVIDFLASKHIEAYHKREAPGIYLNSNGTEAKICSIGLRVRRGCSYHGLAFNIAMNLEPFSRINPCGFERLKMSQLKDWIPNVTIKDIVADIILHLKKHLFYTSIHTSTDLSG